MEVVKKSKIEIEIGLDKDNFPVEIMWSTTDAPANYPRQNAKSFLLSLLDRETGDTLKIDLWTKDTQVGEMDRMMYTTLRAMADSYLKASNNRELAEQMQHFAHYFGEKTEILPKS